MLPVKKAVTLAIILCSVLYSNLTLACMPSVSKRTEYTVHRALSSPLVIKTAGHERATIRVNVLSNNQGCQPEEKGTVESEEQAVQFEEKKNVRRGTAFYREYIFRVVMSGDAQVSIKCKNSNENLISFPVKTEVMPTPKGCQR
jgi:hypothetical protein